VNGFLNGLKETKTAQLAGAVSRTQYVAFTFAEQLLRLQIFSVKLIINLLMIKNSSVIFSYVHQCWDLLYVVSYV